MNSKFYCVGVISAVCDYMGERLASLFGITTPKYQYAIDEYYRMKKEVRGHKHTFTSLSFRCQANISGGIKTTPKKLFIKRHQ